ncbi:hypothetical protein EMIT079MI2_150079 [Bacillus sp. IT-79MI2]
MHFTAHEWAVSFLLIKVSPYYTYDQYEEKYKENMYVGINRSNHRFYIYLNRYHHSMLLDN